MLVAQSCPTLCDPMDSVHKILQARILKWLAIPFLQGIFQNQGSKPGSPTLQTDSLASEPLGATFFQKKEKSRIATKCPQCRALPLRSAAVHTQVETHSLKYKTCGFTEEGRKAYSK